MTPWLVVRGDCRDVLAPASVDAVIADLPWGVTALAWDRLVDGWETAILRALRPRGSAFVFGNFLSLVKLHPAMLAAGWAYAQDIQWEKHNGSGPAPAGKVLRVHETILHYRRAVDRWRDVYHDVPVTTGHMRIKVDRRTSAPHQRPAYKPLTYDSTERRMRSVVRFRSCHGRAVHPTEKPVDLLRQLVRYACPPGGVVLDPFMGSGSTGVAARLEGRRFIGVEIDAFYAQLAAGRISSATC